MFLMRFQYVLKELREEKGLSQNILAKKIGYSSSIVSKWENGKREPTASALLMLSQFFNVTVDYLLGNEK